MSRFTRRTIDKAIGDDRLTLAGESGKGYFYFVFDDGDRYETHSVYCDRLSHMSLEQWIAEGKAFIEEQTK